MRKLLLLTTLIISCNVFAQTPTLQQKLYYTCKVWGFVKYYHSNVSTCGVNWDSVLISVLPSIEAAATDSEFNNALDTMIAAAGPMALSATYFPDTLPANLKFNRDWSWIDASPILRSDVQIQLDTIKNNFRPHAECWVQNNTYTTSYDGWLVFSYDNPELNVATYLSYPDEDSLLLMFFKYWNVVRYFYPYTYVLDTAWDTTLNNYVLPVATVNNSQSLYLLYLKIATALNDAHVYDLTYSGYYQELPGFYMPFIRLKYVGGQYAVINSLVSGINIGDAIISIDGLTTAQWEDSLKPYFSSGNMSIFRRDLATTILGRQSNGMTETLVVEDSTGTDHTITATCVNWYAIDPSFFRGYIYAADSLDTINWTTMPCGAGYINIGNISVAGVDSAYASLKNAPAIIVDIRNYPIASSAWEMADLMYAAPKGFANLTQPDVTYPGTYFWFYDSLGVPGNATPYTGKIIILVNEITQSSAEYSTMILRAIPGAMVMGSQTAGADGNVSYWNLSQDLYTGFTTLGVYYPNGDSTQRIGIVPDSVVYPTRAGFRHGDDEVLDAALQIACSSTSVPKVVPGKTMINVFPNPADGNVTVTATNIGANAAVTLTDVTGRTLLYQEVRNNGQNFSVTLDVRSLAAGMYFVNVITDNGSYIRKVVKE